MIDRVRCGVVLAVCWSVLACSDLAAPDPLGNWGGEGASVVVTASLTQVEFDCAHGEVEGVLVLDGQGSFSAEGVYVREGGPVPSGGREAVPARYQGTVAGDRMTLFVLLDGSEPIGPRELRRGEEPFLRKCL